MVSFKTDNLLIASEEWESVSNELKVDPVNVSTSKNGMIKKNIRMHWRVQTILEVHERISYKQIIMAKTCQKKVEIKTFIGINTLKL